jgi:hypothetical protein
VAAHCAAAAAAAAARSRRRTDKDEQRNAGEDDVAEVDVHFDPRRVRRLRQVAFARLLLRRHKSEQKREQREHRRPQLRGKKRRRADDDREEVRARATRATKGTPASPAARHATSAAPRDWETRDSAAGVEGGKVVARVRAEREAATFALEPRTLPPKSVTYVVTPSDDSTAKAKTMRKGCA